jgi:hypothetical protein
MIACEIGDLRKEGIMIMSWSDEAGLRSQQWKRKLDSSAVGGQESIETFRW